MSAHETWYKIDWFTTSYRNPHNPGLDIGVIRAEEKEAPDWQRQLKDYVVVVDGEPFASREILTAAGIFTRRMTGTFVKFGRRKMFLVTPSMINDMHEAADYHGADVDVSRRQESLANWFSSFYTVDVVDDARAQLNALLS